MQYKIQNTGKTPVKTKYWKFLQINTVHYALLYSFFIIIYNMDYLALSKTAVKQL